MGEKRSFARLVARIERKIVGGFMGMIAFVAERRVRKSLEGQSKKHPGRATVHVDLEDRLR